MRLFILFTLLIQNLIFANGTEPSEINWISFEKAIELNKTNPKPIIIDVYTDWCGWCKVMDKKTFKNPVITQYINKHYYAVKFDGEQKEPLTYRGKTFNFVPSGRTGYNEFTIQLLNGKLSYPSVVFFNKNEEFLQTLPGYKDKEQMEKLLSFFAEEAYLTQEWESFNKNFKSKL